MPSSQGVVEADVAEIANGFTQTLIRVALVVSQP